MYSLYTVYIIIYIYIICFHNEPVFHPEKLSGLRDPQRSLLPGLPGTSLHRQPTLQHVLVVPRARRKSKGAAWLKFILFRGGFTLRSSAMATENPLFIG